MGRDGRAKRARDVAHWGSQGWTPLPHCPERSAIRRTHRPLRALRSLRSLRLEWRALWLARFDEEVYAPKRGINLKTGPSACFFTSVLIAVSACSTCACSRFEALLANSSDGTRRTSVDGDFDVRHLSSASLAFARRARFDLDSSFRGLSGPRQKLSQSSSLPPALAGAGLGAAGLGAGAAGAVLPALGAVRLAAGLLLLLALLPRLLRAGAL